MRPAGSVGRLHLERPLPILTPDQVEEAARVEPDATLATSFLEPDARARVIALLLFGHEIGRARTVVSEPGLAAIRLQWWRDTIDQIYTSKVVRAQPTAIALAETVREVALPRQLFDEMINGYEAELEAQPFAAWQDLYEYLSATHGNLMRLCLLAAGTPTITSTLNEAARQAGTAWGLSQLMRALPQWCSRRSLWLPKTDTQNLNLELLFNGEVTPQLVGCLKGVQAQIKQSRQHANAALRTANVGAPFPVFAKTCLASRYAKIHFPNVGKDWTIAADPSLLERQLRLTIAVACRRV